MPIKHRVDPASNTMFVTRSGSIDTHDEEQAQRERQTDPLVVPGIAVLVDCREVEPADSTEVVQYLADNITALAANLQCGPVAIVVSSEVEYGMARMYQLMTDLEHPETAVFRDYREALDWLRQASRPAAK
jgi:hypothetical protein